MNGTRGPKCETCADEDHHFDEKVARCVKCEDTTAVWVRLWLIISGICMFIGAIYLVIRSPPPALAKLVTRFLMNAQWVYRIGVVPMTKLCFVFAQV